MLGRLVEGPRRRIPGGRRERRGAFCSVTTGACGCAGVTEIGEGWADATAGASVIFSCVSCFLLAESKPAAMTVTLTSSP